jgi:hypothetical protein
MIDVFTNPDAAIATVICLAVFAGVCLKMLAR